MEDPEFDTVDVLEVWKGLDIIGIGDDGLIEIFGDEECDTIEDEAGNALCPKLN